MATLTIQSTGRSVPVSAAISLLNSLLREEVAISHTCGGRAQCGTCRIRIIEGAENLTRPNSLEKERLGEELIKQGYRLACQTHAAGDMVIEIPPKENHGNR
jgi:adenylate cyclase